MENLTITKMSKDDLEGIYEVEKTAFPIPWPISSFEEELKNMLATYLVAKIDNKVVGYLGLWFVMDECHITNIAVHADYRRNKIASTLITSYILLEVRKSNVEAISLYKKYGFKNDAIRKNYYKNPDNTHEDAIMMSLELY